MKRSIFFMMLCFVAETLPAQDDNTLQTDSVYKARNVKTRTEYNNISHHNKIVYSFNRQGLITQIGSYGKSGTNYIITQLIYDNQGKLIKEDCFIHYWKRDSTRKKHKSKEASDSNLLHTTFFSYDDTGRLKATADIQFYGNSCLTRTYYRSATLMTSFENYDGVITIDSVFFEAPGISIREKMILNKPGNPPEIRDTKYKNYFDKQGRILKRKRIIERLSQVNTGEFDTEEFMYNKKGLLVEKIKKYHLSPVKLRFTYEYW